MNFPRGSTGTFRLFVYGTLKRGGCRHAALASQRCLGEAKTTAGYALHNLGDYPGLVTCPEGGQVVHGELYEVDHGLVDWLDATEGSPDWFKLGPVEVVGVSGAVWAYFYQGEPGDRPRVASGRWENPP
ncbi:MAG: gamma-glutamylcyclotransferase family protein [Gemmataceae bacterium]